LVVAMSLACEREREREPQVEVETELDAGALRASAIEGLQAAANDPVLASKLALATALEHPDVELAIERMLARVSADPQLSAVADSFFAEVQESSAMRTALAEFARANPELDLTALTEGFVAHVDERLTQTEVADAIEAVLRLELRASEPALARAMLIEAGAAELLGSAIVVSFANPEIRAALEQRLGKDPGALQQRLERHLAEPGRHGMLVGQLGEQARSEAGLAAFIAILDHETTATLLAGALARVLDDAAVRQRCEALFGLALASRLDASGFTSELRELLDEPAVVREAAVLLDAIAREPFTREQVASLAAAVVAAPGFADRVLDAID
jgi:hypothetical protein